VKRTSNIFYKIDWVVVLIYLLLVFAGWINIYSVVFDQENSSVLDFGTKYGKQLIWIFAALSVGTIVLLIDQRFFPMFSSVIYAFTIALLLAVLVFGKEINGARSWISIGAFRLQPAEFAKMATLLILAKFMSRPNFSVFKVKDMLKIGLYLFAPFALILLQNDTGSALVYVAFILVLFREGLPGWVLLTGVGLIILFIVSLLFSPIVILISLLLLLLLIYIRISLDKRKALYVTGSLASLSVALFIVNKYVELNMNDYVVVMLPAALYTPFLLFSFARKKLKRGLFLLLFFWGSVGVNYSVDYVFYNILEEHHRKRINDLLGIESDPYGWGYNVNQSKIAIGSGGFSGKGFLHGTQTKLKFVPEQSTDFIFCTVGEEWGFLGSLFVIGLFVLLLIKIIQIAERQRLAFARIYAYGVLSILFFHFAVNIGMTIGVVPVIGIPLPFFSYGGSSLWGFTILLFILLNLDASRFELVR
jgi:rod shape determining protein RodA